MFPVRIFLSQISTSVKCLIDCIGATPTFGFLWEACSLSRMSLKEDSLRLLNRWSWMLFPQLWKLNLWSDRKIKTSTSEPLLIFTFSAWPGYLSQTKPSQKDLKPYEMISPAPVFAVCVSQEWKHQSKDRALSLLSSLLRSQLLEQNWHH